MPKYRLRLSTLFMLNLAMSSTQLRAMILVLRVSSGQMRKWIMLESESVVMRWCLNMGCLGTRGTCRSGVRFRMWDLLTRSVNWGSGYITGIGTGGGWVMGRIISKGSDGLVLLIMDNNKQKDQFEDLGEVELNQNGRPKQAVVLYELTPQMIEEAKQKIDKDVNVLPEKKYQQAKEKAAKVWDSFYSNHKCNFFKDRNYLEREIKQIKYFRQKHQLDNEIYTYLQLGCGVGNTLFPLLREYPYFKYQGCDISAQAIKLIEKEMQDHPQYQQRLTVRVCDVVKDEIPFEIKPDLISMIFVLSAIVPEEHQNVINKVAKWMKPGSCFFFRDYGRYDFGQVNMSNKGNRKLRENFYVKHDGVCVYYFEQEEMEKMFVSAGLVKAEASIHCRLLQNRKTGLKMYRIWVQGRFYKPPVHEFFAKRIEEEKDLKKAESQDKQQKVQPIELKCQQNKEQKVKQSQESHKKVQQVDKQDVKNDQQGSQQKQQKRQGDIQPKKQSDQ